MLDMLKTSGGLKLSATQGSSTDPGAKKCADATVATIPSSNNGRICLKEQL